MSSSTSTTILVAFDLANGRELWRSLVRVHGKWRVVDDRPLRDYR